VETPLQLEREGEGGRVGLGVHGRSYWVTLRDSRVN
jgi:hypothetical protein